jgi:predicted dehydrogenase
MNPESPRLLILGAGSAGRRHGRNLRQLGAEVSVFDPRADRGAQFREEGATGAVFADLAEAVHAQPWDGCLIASPPCFHVDQIVRFAAAHPGRKIYSEKPLGIDAPSCSPLLPFGADILLGYTYRWWEPLVEMRRRLREKAVGSVRHARFVMSAHLADWHPWEPYQEFFMASREQGGGALLDESHFIDLALWMFGAPASVFAQVEHVSDLEIDADDHVDILLVTKEGTRVNLHLDLIGRPHERSITVVGEKGTLAYTYDDNTLRQSASEEKKWEETRFTCERNDMFMAAAAEYVAWIKNPDRVPTCGLEDGLAVLRVVDACRESSARGNRISFP